MARPTSITLLLMVIIIRKQAGVEATFDFEGKGKKGGGYDDGGYGGGYGGGGYGYDDHGGGYGHEDGYGDSYGKGGGKGTGTSCIVKGSYCQCHYCKVKQNIFFCSDIMKIDFSASMATSIVERVGVKVEKEDMVGGRGAREEVADTGCFCFPYSYYHYYHFMITII